MSLFESPRRLRCVVRNVLMSLCIVCAVATTARASAQPAAKPHQVLVLNSYTMTYAWTANIVKGIQSVFGSTGNVELSIDFMDTKKIYTPEYAQLLANVLSQKYSRLKFDLIISSDDDALNFLLKYRDTLFPNVPVVFCGVNNFRDERLGGQRGLTGVNEENDYDGSFEWIAKHRPATKNVLIVVDDTATSTSYINRITATRARWAKHFKIDFTAKVTIAELQTQLRALGQDSVVFWAMFMRDAANVPLSFNQSVAMVVKASPVPVFGFMDITVGQGATGGIVVSGFAQGQYAARLGQRILAGEPVDSVPIVRQSPNVFMFDYPSMQRWGIAESSIPKGAEVLNRPVTFYQQYKRYVWAALGGMGLESAAIVVLVLMIRTITRKNRKRLRESEERYRSIVEDGSELICRLDPHHILRFSNGAFARFVDADAATLTGQPLRQILSLDGVALAALEELNPTNTTKSFEVQCRRGDGANRWVMWNCRGFFSDQGELTEVQLVGHDTTDRRQAEAALQTANTNLQGVLDGMQEALVVCDCRGALGEIRSRAAAEWFGEPTVGDSVTDYLYDVDGRAKAQFEVSLSQVVDDVLPFITAVEQLPKLLHRNERAFRIECHRVDRNGEFSGLIFVLTDVTTELQQERVERMNRELPAVVGNLLRDREGFQAFVQDTDELLTKLTTSEDRSELRRVLHTMKGNTAIYGFEYFASRCHALEDAMQADESEPNESSIVTLTTQWRESLDSFAMFLTQEGPDGVELATAEYRDLLERLAQGQDHAALLRTAKRWENPRLEQVLGIYGRTVKQLARRFNKEVEVEIEDNGLRLPRGEMRWFLSVLVHVVRNCVDHGIEAPDVREARGKPRTGRVKIESSVEGSTFAITISDDGAGIQWDGICRRAQAMGLPHDTPGELEAALFHDGLSTKESVSEISGRGVGLGAVIDSCKQLGGTLRVSSELGQGTHFEFRFVLPSLLPAPLRPLAAIRPAAASGTIARASVPAKAREVR